MRTIDRYALKELLVPFLIGTVAVVLMFQANLLIFQYKTFSFSAIPLLASLQLVLYETPGFLNMTLPVATALAVSLAVSRFTRETELTAMRSAGARILRVIAPMAFFGLLVGVGNFLLAEYVMPPSKRESAKLQREIQLLGAAPEFKSNVTVNLRNYSVNVALVRRAEDGAVELQDVLLIERPRPGEIWLWTSKQGEYRDGVWRLRNTSIRVISDDGTVNLKPGEDVVINEQISLEAFFAPPAPEEQSVAELRKAIAESKLAGWDASSLEVALHNRFSIPAACLVFALVAPVFAVVFSRGGPFVGVLVSLILVWLYYNAWIISTQIFGMQKILSPFLSAWLPNIAFAAAGLFMLRRLE